MIRRKKAVNIDIQLDNKVKSLGQEVKFKVHWVINKMANKDIFLNKRVSFFVP